MKIALCLSGQPRFIEKAYQSIYENILEPNSPDVFVHTWFDPAAREPFRDNNNWQNFQNNKPLENTPELIQRLYNPVLCQYEAPGTFKNSKWDLTHTRDVYMPGLTDPGAEKYLVDTMHSMWYSIYQSNLLKERYRLTNDMDYDYVIRCRFDSLLSMKIQCDQYNPSILRIGGVKPFPEQVSDWFAFGNGTHMNVYSNVFNFLDVFYQKRMRGNRLFSNEDALYEQLTHFQVPYKPIDGFNISFVRPWN